MIIHDVEQNTPEWYAAKAGIPSASEFDKIITAGGKASEQATKYMNRLLAEMRVGKSLDTMYQKTAWMDRGNELEAEAVSFYNLTKGVELIRVGFITDDKKEVGCSPDRITPDKRRGAEFKCPAPHTHIEYMLDPLKLRKEYHVQVQGQFHVGKFELIDLVSYCPELPPVILTVEPDWAFLGLMKRELDGFALEMERRRLKLCKQYGSWGDA